MSHEPASHDETPGPVVAPKEAWDKPEIVAFEPVSNAQGISYNPLDGISNLTA